MLSLARYFLSMCFLVAIVPCHSQSLWSYQNWLENLFSPTRLERYGPNITITTDGATERCQENQLYCDTRATESGSNGQCNTILCSDHSRHRMTGYTDFATVSINVPSNWVIFLLEIRLDNIPEKMEVYMKSGDSQNLLAVFTDDCKRKYNMEPYHLPYMNTLSRRRRSSDSLEPQPKCFHKKDVYEIEMGGFMIPFIGANDEGAAFSDRLMGDRLVIHLTGHLNAHLKEQRWYGVGRISLLGRPHCDGHAYRQTEPFTEKYECTCPEGLSGDFCGTCTETRWRYVKRPGICASCNCTSFSQSEECNSDTGQCPCSPIGVNLTDIESAGRQCHWFISKIYPLYGPVAGGTTLRVSGGYMFSVLNNIFNMTRRSPTELTLVTTPADSSREGQRTLRLILEPNSDYRDVGPTTKAYVFDYRPNPIIEDINPRISVISGGIKISVFGKFLDSVAQPEMIVYVRQENVILWEYQTVCDVLNSTVMVCPTPQMNQTTTDTSTTTTSATTVTSEGNGSGDFNMTQPPSRRRRQIRGIKFTLGFKFDGYKEYNDLYLSPNETLRRLSELYVYEDPIIDRFIGGILEFKQEDDKTVKITGQRLLQSLISQYVVRIGMDGVCQVISLTSNQINCLPPSTAPAYHDYDTKKHRGKHIPNVVVNLGNFQFTVGYIYYMTNIWNDNEGFRAGIIVLIILLVLLCVAIPIIYYLCKVRRKRQMQQDKTYLYTKGGDEVETRPFFGQKINEELKAKIKRCSIPRNRLTIREQLGKGNFGRVFKGQLISPKDKMLTVAIKSLRDDKEVGLEELESFLTEGTIMIDFKHKNVLSLIGVVWEENDRPLVVLPFMENGDLHTFMKNQNMDFVLGDILHFALQIANGMLYLSEEHFVHRDLAARNCMVDGVFIVKIADFGLSRDIYEKDYYRMEDKNKELPIKWMAIESLLEGKYSTKSDVWSYAITIWELLTRGSSPYPGVSNYHIKEYVNAGKRLDRPECCPPVIFNMMCMCWEAKPEDRPTFAYISNFLTEVLHSSSPGKEKEETDGYSYERQYTRDIPRDYYSYIDDNTDCYLQPTTSAADCYVRPASTENDYVQPMTSSKQPVM